jgi:hypothetical protein
MAMHDSFRQLPTRVETPVRGNVTSTLTVKRIREHRSKVFGLFDWSCCYSQSPRQKRNLASTLFGELVQLEFVTAVMASNIA